MVYNGNEKLFFKLPVFTLKEGTCRVYFRLNFQWVIIKHFSTTWCTFKNFFTTLFTTTKLFVKATKIMTARGGRQPFFIRFWSRPLCVFLRQKGLLLKQQTNPRPINEFHCLVTLISAILVSWKFEIEWNSYKIKLFICFFKVYVTVYKSLRFFNTKGFCTVFLMS